MEEMFQRVKLAVPAFHAYGHKAECQVKIDFLHNNNYKIINFVIA